MQELKVASSVQQLHINFFFDYYETDSVTATASSWFSRSKHAFGPLFVLLSKQLYRTNETYSLHQNSTIL